MKGSLSGAANRALSLLSSMFLRPLGFSNNELASGALVGRSSSLEMLPGFGGPLDAEARAQNG